MVVGYRETIMEWLGCPVYLPDPSQGFVSGSGPDGNQYLLLSWTVNGSGSP